MKTRTHTHGRTIPPPLHYRVMHAVVCPVMKLFGLSCRQFAELASVRMDRPLTKLESLRFRFHRMMCGLCRNLPGQLANLRTLTRCVCQAEPDEKPGAAEEADLSPEARQRLREALAAESRSSSHS
jgi:predicted anti-sigma-YlaC factor YlaD